VVVVSFSCFADNDLVNHRLALWNERPLTAWQRSEKRQLHSLHRCLDSAQGVAANRNLVRGEDQAKVLFFSFVLEFGENELVKR